MEHLSGEALARLVDELPTAEERLHLETCDACQRELEVHREQASALAGLPDVRPPRGEWESLEARLLSEGLLDVGRRAGYPVLASTPRWMRAAAAVVLFVAGAATGAGLAGGDAPWLGAGPTGPEASLGTLASIGEGADLDRAAAVVQVAERNYIEALTRYRQLLAREGGGGSVEDPERRYAALEYLVRAGQAAVREAPADPFLNGFLASAIAEQRALARRVPPSDREDNWF